MVVWRICKSKHAGSAFSGIGAERHGGRWNFVGPRMVYTSENLSLATLELFVHVDPRVAPTDHVAILAKLPKGFSKTELDVASLPKNWRTYPASGELQEIGTDWLNSNSALALVVPSAVNPIDKNILLNPDHPEMEYVSIEPPERFDFDARMFT